MDQLSRKYLNGQVSSTLMSLPEKVLQFGTGVLLRGLPDYLIDQANRKGVFNGRIVVVKSTSGGDIAAFKEQDAMYTLCVRGYDQGAEVSENIISTAISRVLSADEQWEEILACAANPALEIVISNTTEVGIQLVRENIHQAPPESFPGKLLAFLLARYQAFAGDKSKGLVVVPTELVPQNGTLLESIILELAHLNKLDYEFIEWLENTCVFCNSLVDRIVPGQPAAAKQAQFFKALGYSDRLLIMAEPYALWAVEGDESVAKTLSFQKACGASVIVEKDINRFRELKLRLLNGTHTLSCGLAHLAGFSTVSEAMEDPEMLAFIESLMLREITPAIPYPIPKADAELYSRQVLDRFRNPFVDHRWISIAAQYSAKMRMRNMPLLLEHYKKNDAPPVLFALGFAAFLCFYKNPKDTTQDDNAAYFIEKWQSNSPKEMVWNILSDTRIWGSDLTELPGFANEVHQFVLAILNKGARQVLHETVLKYETENIANPSA